MIDILRWVNQKSVEVPWSGESGVVNAEIEFIDPDWGLTDSRADRLEKLTERIVARNYSEWDSDDEPHGCLDFRIYKRGKVTISLYVYVMVERRKARLRLNIYI